MKVKRYVWIALKVFGGLIVVLALAVAAVLWNAARKIDRKIELDIAPVAYSTDAGSVERGRYLYLARGCADCHGETGKGKVFIDDPIGLYVRGANITTGRNSAVTGYNERDWVRAIRHGVGINGRALFPMPSDEYNRLSDNDLADMVAFIRALPPADSDGGLVTLPLPVRVLYGAGIVKDAPEKIDHTLPPPQPVANTATIERGRYVAYGCTACHGASLRGGPVPGAPPTWPPAANITSAEGSVMGRYETVEQFKTMMRTAVRPDGTRVHPAMPFQALRHTNDIDLEGLYLFLKSPASAN